MFVCGYRTPLNGTNSTAKTEWVIFLMGGGVCYTYETCSARAQTTLGSSLGWPLQWPTIPGVLNDELGENPFKNANHVFVPCVAHHPHLAFARILNQRIPLRVFHVL